MINTETKRGMVIKKFTEASISSVFVCFALSFIINNCFILIKLWSVCFLGDYSRRLSRDGERSRYEVEPYRSRDKERERERDHERDRERERERARERGRDRDFERVKDRERVREKEGDRDNDRNLSKDKDHDKNPRSKSESRVKSESSNKSEPGTPEDHGERRSRDSGVMQHYPHPQGPYMVRDLIYHIHSTTFKSLFWCM